MTIKPKEKQNQDRYLLSKFHPITKRIIIITDLIIVFVFIYLGLKVFSLINGKESFSIISFLYHLFDFSNRHMTL